VSKIIFHINYDSDLKNTLSRITSYDPATLDYRISKKGLDRQVVDNILAAETEEAQKKILEEYLKKVYREILPEMEEVKKTYTDIWKGKSEKFFKITKNLMGNFPWNHEEYYLLVSAFFSMASHGRTNNLAVWYKRDPKKYYFWNGYELILSHVFEIIHQKYEKRPVSFYHIWALAEITAHILVYKEEKLISAIWPHMNTLLETPIFEGLKSGSYPQLAAPAEKVHSIYNQFPDYEKFVEESIDYIKTIPRKKLMKK